MILKYHLTNWKNADKVQTARSLGLTMGQVAAVSAWAAPTLGGKRYAQKYLPKEFVEEHWNEFCSNRR